MIKFSTLRTIVLPIVVGFGLVGQSPNTAWAKTSELFSVPAVSAKLITVQNAVAKDSATISAGLDLVLGDGWKTYWRSPGEVGLPPQIDWSGSKNVADVEILWPAPTRFTAFGIENFGYGNEVVLPVQVQLEQPGEPVSLVANVSLLTCSDICVPQNFVLNLVLPSGSGIDQDVADRISAFVERVPLEGKATRIGSATLHLDEGFTELTVSASSDVPFKQPDVFPELGIGTALGKPDIRLGGGGRQLWARFPVLSHDETLSAEPLLTITDVTGRAITVSPDLVGTPPVPPFRLDAFAPGLDQIAWIAVIAFLGGMILNVMPCVLPVLSIKLSSALKHQGRDQLAIRGGFLAAAAGVMVFMWGLAAALFALQQLGTVVGWGLQFQSPVFLALMFTILSVFSANLFGLFEFSLPSRLQTKLADTGRGHGYASDFLTGMFGAVMATPCSAPFLGTAIAFALAGRGIDLLVVFTFLGLGLAIPYLTVAAAPKLITVLPKPGRWMIGLKLVLGALLIITALWIFWVLTGVAGVRSAVAVAALSAVLVMVISLGTMAPRLRWAGVAVFSLLPLIASSMLAQQVTAQGEPQAHNWVTFDRAEIARLVSRGEVVFVDVTADWCLTCKANKALVLDRDPVLSVLQAEDVTPMQADWTRPDEAISRYLAQFGRFGIPFNAVYGPGAPEGIVLSEILSSSAVLQAVEDARRRIPDVEKLTQDLVATVPVPSADVSSKPRE
ncbi:protein-disulfide reductase DsbD family protein [Aliiroseovarius crassostreae]|uniref:protein-disulfide reductase DsbD family protein n=1 Tax=Aliiroseovarius crassostreae TaxID=154981 RepID=UPI00220180C4|nr:protein-disulfide reductase DsbD domain-containing protein [Aliiroseovarius crassostreae]UWQ00240.1 thioredoxin family protein [Aliiroseovarius crassostreae]